MGWNLRLAGGREAEGWRLWMLGWNMERAGGREGEEWRLDAEVVLVETWRKGRGGGV